MWLGATRTEKEASRRGAKGAQEEGIGSSRFGGHGSNLQGDSSDESVRQCLANERDECGSCPLQKRRRRAEAGVPAESMTQ